MIMAGTMAVAARKSTAHCTRSAQDLLNLPQLATTSATAAPNSSENSKSVDFIDTPKQSPSRRPATSARRTPVAPPIKTVTHNNQIGVHKLSVRNSKTLE